MAKQMTVEEAGRKGGMATKRNHDSKFFKKIGRKGGKAHARKLLKSGVSLELHAKLSIAGKKGGIKTRDTYGKEFYVNIGRKGGKSKKKKVSGIENDGIAKPGMARGCYPRVP